MYTKIWTLVDKGLAAVKKNKDKMGEGAPFPPEMLDKGLGTAEKFLALAKEAKLNDFEAMKKLNVAAFLAENGKKLSDFAWQAGESFEKDKVTQAKQMLDSIKAEAKDVKENEATVIVTVGEDKQEIKFAKVEGKWIPKDMADMWPKVKEKTDKEIDKAMAELDKNKDKLKEMLKAAEEGLTKFETSGKMEDLAPLMGAMQAL